MTKLFPIPLLGAGTEDVECLSSYLIRLSIAHGRSVHQFLYFLSDWSCTHEEDVQMPARFSFEIVITTLSKANETAKELLRVLDKVSSVTGLRAATLQCLSESFRRMAFSISATLRWCPQCMAEWETTKETAYFKLVWLFSHAEYCHHHHVALINRCPACNCLQSGYSFKKSLSMCGKCSAPLSAHSNQLEVVPVRRRTAGDIFHLVEQIALNPNLNFDGKGVERILKAFKRRAEESGEVFDAFNAIFPVYWKHFGPQHRNLSFEETRAFAVIVGIPLFDALQGNCVDRTRAISYSWSEGTRSQWKTESRKRRDFEAMRLALTQHLMKTRGAHPSLKSVAEALGVSVGYLRYRFSNQALMITRDYQARKKYMAWTQRLAARKAAERYFLGTKANDQNKSRKSALRELRTATGLSKGLLRSQIAEVYETRCLR